MIVKVSVAPFVSLALGWKLNGWPTTAMPGTTPPITGGVVSTGVIAVGAGVAVFAVASVVPHRASIAAPATSQDRYDPRRTLAPTGYAQGVVL